LRENGDASFVNPGWLPVRGQLPTTYHSSYSSRFTDQIAWYRIDAVSAQVDELVARVPRLVISGDVAVDRVRPWRVPTVAIVYGEIAADTMDELGFVRADSAAMASVLVRPFPDDRFFGESELVDDLLIAPQLHLVADLIDLGGDDRLEAAARFARNTQAQQNLVAALLLSNLDAVAEDLDAGAIVVIDQDRIRVRRLPLGT